MNTNQRNHPWNRYCLSIVARLPHSQGHCLGNKENAIRKKTNYEFECLGIPPSEATELHTLWYAFPRVAQNLYPKERPDAVLGQYLHFTQIPHHEKVNSETGLSKGYKIMIRFDMGFKTMNRVHVKSVCLTRLRKMRILLETDYTNPLDIGSRLVTKNWAGHHQNGPQTSTCWWNASLTRYLCLCIGIGRGWNGNRKGRERLHTCHLSL